MKHQSDTQNRRYEFPELSENANTDVMQRHIIAHLMISSEHNSLYQYQHLPFWKSYLSPRISDSDSRFQTLQQLQQRLQSLTRIPRQGLQQIITLSRSSIDILRKGYPNRQLHSPSAVLKHRNCLNPTSKNYPCYLTITYKNIWYLYSTRISTTVTLLLIIREVNINNVWSSSLQTLQLD